VSKEIVLPLLIRQLLEEKAGRRRKKQHVLSTSIRLKAHLREWLEVQAGTLGICPQFLLEWIVEGVMLATEKELQDQESTLHGNAFSATGNAQPA
jgi:hypothetical protein